MESNVLSLTAIQNYLLSQQKYIWSTTQDSHQHPAQEEKKHFHVAYYKYCCCFGLKPIFQFKTYLYKKKLSLLVVPHWNGDNSNTLKKHTKKM